MTNLFNLTLDPSSAGTSSLQT